jgi:hypothetical protein
MTANLQIATIASAHAGTNVAKKGGMSSHAVLFGCTLMGMGLCNCHAGGSFEEMRISWATERGRWEPIREGV